MDMLNRNNDRAARILIVEDESIVALDLARHLKSLGYAVVGTVASGEEAVQVAEMTRPDLALMDIKLKGEMDGIDAAQRIRERLDTAIVYLTAYSERADLFERAKLTEPHGYLFKPLSYLELDRTVEIALYKHRMAKALREDRELLNLIIDALPVGVVYVDAAGRFRFSNKIHKQWWAVSHDEVNGRTLEEVIGTDAYRGAIQDRVKRALDGQHVSYETTVSFKDGISRHIAANYVPHYDTDGQFKGFVGLVADVSRSRTVEENLRIHQVELETQNEELREAHRDLAVMRDKYLELYDFAPVGHVTVSAPGLVQEANLTACRLLGVERRHFINQPFSRYVGRDCQDAFYLHLNRLRDTKSKETCELTLHRSDGTDLFCQLQSLPVCDAAGEMTGCGIAISDMSDLKRSQEALTVTNEKLTRSLAEKEVLLREIHHRVKNNLTVISSLVNLQAGYTSDLPAQRMFEDVRARVRSMALAHEFLYQSSSLAEISIRDYITKLVDHLMSSIRTVGRAINVTQDTDDVRFTLDTAIPLGFIVTELVSNAIKHAFPGRQENDIRIALRSVDDHSMELIVADNGVGMPEAIDPANPGSLGLDLVNTFVEQLAGEIHFSRNEGTTVRITFRPKEKG